MVAGWLPSPMPVQQNSADGDTGADSSEGGTEHGTASRTEHRGRIMTDGGTDTERGDVDPETLAPHEKNREIYGDDPDIEGMVTDMEAEGYDAGSPLTVTPDDRVVKGHRRWAAAKEAGIDAVPVVRREFNSENDEEAALLLDNLLQRDQTFSQKMREALELERINDEVDGGIQAEVVDEFLNGGEGRTRDQIATAVGFGSGETYRRAKRVWEAAEDGDDDAAEEVELIDSGEQSIHGAFTALQDDPEPDETEDEDDTDTGADDVDEPDDGVPEDTPRFATDENESGDGNATPESDTGSDDLDVSDEEPPSPAELDDRDDPSEEMHTGKGGGGGVGEDAGMSTAEMAEQAEDDETEQASETASLDQDSDPVSGPSDESSSDDDDEAIESDDAQVVEDDALVVGDETAEKIRERAEDEDRDPEEMLDELITAGQISEGAGESDPEDEEGEGDDENDEADDEADDGVLVRLTDEKEEEVRARARELDLEPDEVVNRLVDAWVDGDEAPFQAE